MRLHYRFLQHIQIQLGGCILTIEIIRLRIDQKMF